MDTIIIGPEALAAMDPKVRYVLLEQARRAIGGWQVVGLNEWRLSETQVRVIIDWEYHRAAPE